MAEVITLSDDDDDIIDITPKPAPVVLRTSTSLNQVDNNLGATAHISTVSKINLEQFGIRTLATVLNRNQSPIVQNAGYNPLLRYALPPVSAQPNHQHSIPRALKRPSPSPAVPNVSHQSTPTLRQRNSTTVPSTYKGHYMFEATEAYEPSRRSSRFGTKKLEGQFVCSFNSTKCYKLCDSVVGFINHLWSHVVYDPPFIPIKKKEPKTHGLYTPGSLYDTAALSKCSVLALKKMQTCEFCHAIFKTIYQKQQHRFKCHFDQDLTKTICNICEINFESTSILEAHNRKHTSGEAPYKCEKCNYRTSVRAFFYEHFIERHINDTLVCPICLHQEELPSASRRTKHIFVNSFVEHMRNHAMSSQYRCQVCSLTFNDRASLNYHRSHDHTLLDPLWQVHERPKIHETVEVELITKPKKINNLNKQFLQTPEGHRMSHEVECDEEEERPGYDLTCTGNTLFECECGFSSWNGNRAASHYYRCRKTIKCVLKDIERDKELVRTESDPKDELDIFAVYPQPTSQEEEAEALQEAALRKLHLEKDAPVKLRTETLVYTNDDDFFSLKMFSNNKESDDIIAECIASIISEDD